MTNAPQSNPPIKLLTVYRELPADLETPVSIYYRLLEHGPSFLLESVTGGEQVARYSFIGINPSQAFVLRGSQLTTVNFNNGASSTQTETVADPIQALRERFNKYELTDHPNLPRFSGGFVGYFGYGMIRFFEPSVELSPDPSTPDAVLLHADTLIAFDHAFGRLLLIANVPLANGEPAARVEANALLDALEVQINAPLVIPPHKPITLSNGDFISNTSRDDFMSAVIAAKVRITAGDIFQVVLSQKLTRTTSARPFEIYRLLRRLNPSPYMFFYDFDNLAGDLPFYLIGASPEMHVRFENGIASLRPIAGTRPRGTNPKEDLALEAELLADPKECAEHIMLVDLARNDLGRVCAYGSIDVPERMIVERYSHVMHIVSHTEGVLRPGMDAFDLLAATFPAGTVSGAPKIKAMQIINDLEPEPRGAYAGAVGYFSYNGSSDTCIAIRTLTMHGDRVSVQAGAGIVADSDPATEYQETLNKAKAIAEAVAQAETLS